MRRPRKFLVFTVASIEYCATPMIKINKALVAMFLCWCALALSPLALATVFYVDKQNPSASDSNPGTLAAPWKTIQKAASTATAGDRVIIKAGEYNEYVSNQNSGAAGSPLTFEGERGANGEWLTIIDPSTDISGGWVAAPEVGSGVYKRTNLTFRAREVYINNKRLLGAYDSGTMSTITDAYPSGPTTGNGVLTLATNATLTGGGYGHTYTWWNGIEAFYTSRTNTGYGTWVVYLRMRDQSNPNGLNIRAARNHNDYTSDQVFYPTISIDGRSYLVYSNLWVRNGYCQVWMKGTGAHHNVIAGNYLSGGFCRVNLQQGPYANRILRNMLTTSLYGGTTNTGAWEPSTSSLALTRENIYEVAKYVFTLNQTTHDKDIYLYQAGNSNVIAFNTMSNSIGGSVQLTGDIAAPTYYTEVYSNTVKANTSFGLTFSPGVSRTKVYGNLFSDCNSVVRFDQYNYDGESDRTNWIYRNMSYQPTGMGQHIFVHFNSSSVTYCPESWFYHNSFSGGSLGFTFGLSKGATNLHFLNNIFSGMDYYSTQGWVGEFDYNIANPKTHPAWFGAHNIEQSTPQWVNAADMSFGLTNGSQAIDTGLDIPTTHPTLPETSTSKVGSAWDRGALEYGEVGPSSLEPPSNLRVIAVINP